MRVRSLTRRPLVTVVMAAYNAAPHIGAALASLRCQTMDDFEAIVVDDGSTDSTPRIAEPLARRDRWLRLVRSPRNRGQAAALNVGLEQAQGRYLAILDADDEATPERLERQVAALEIDRGLVLVGGAVEPWCDRHKKAGKVWRYAADDATIRVRSFFKSEFISGAITFDRERFARHRLRFDESLRLGADWALSNEAMSLGRVANLNEVVMRYRVHGGQLTSGMMDDLGSDSARIRLAALARLPVFPRDEELRTHLAVSPCNYWPFGAHPYFRERRASIAREARRWFETLRTAAERSRRVSEEHLRAYLGDIESQIAECLATPDEAPGARVRSCPVANPKACLFGPPGCARPAVPPGAL